MKKNVPKDWVCLYDSNLGLGVHKRQHANLNFFWKPSPICHALVYFCHKIRNPPPLFTWRHLWMLINHFCFFWSTERSVIVSVGYTLSLLFGMLTPIANPVLYGLLNDSFKEVICKMFSCIYRWVIFTLNFFQTIPL